MQFFRVNGKKIGKRESIWGKVEIIALPIQQPYIWFWKSPPLICQFKVIELPFSAPLPFCSLPPSSPSPSPPLPPARSRRLPSSMASSTLSRWLRPEVCALSVPLYFYYSLSVVDPPPPPLRLPMNLSMISVVIYAIRFSLCSQRSVLRWGSAASSLSATSASTRKWGIPMISSK